MANAQQAPKVCKKKPPSQQAGPFNHKGDGPFQHYEAELVLTLMEGEETPSGHDRRSAEHAGAFAEEASTSSRDDGRRTSDSSRQQQPAETLEARRFEARSILNTLLRDAVAKTIPWDDADGDSSTSRTQVFIDTGLRKCRNILRSSLRYVQRARTDHRMRAVLAIIGVSLVLLFYLSLFAFDIGRVRPNMMHENAAQPARLCAAHFDPSN